MSKKKILIMPLYGIGDVLMATPALRNLKEKSGAHITFLHMFKTTRDILLGNPSVDESLYFPFVEPGKKFQGIKFLLGLKGKYDLSINLYPSNRRDYSLAAFLAGCPVRIGHRYKMRDLKELNFLKNRTVMEDDALHNAEENFRLLEFLGIHDPVPYPMQIFLTPEEEEKALAWLREKGIQNSPLMGFHPGSSVFKSHAKKRWPLEKFAALINEMEKLYPEFSYLLFGGPEEDPLKEELKNMCKNPGKVFYPGNFNIRETAALMKMCRAFLANDSGLMHLSGALQVPTAAIFGPTNPRWLAPWKCPHKVIRLGYDCSPCFRYSPVPQRCLRGIDFECVREIKVGMVLEALSYLVS